MKKLKVKRIIATLLMTIMCVTSIIGCGSNDVPEEVEEEEEEEEEEEITSYEDITDWPSATSSIFGQKLIANLNNKYYDLTDVGLGLAHGKRARANVIYKNIVTIQMRGNVRIEQYSGNFRRYVQNYKVAYDRKTNITSLSFRLNSTGKRIKKNRLISTIKAIDNDTNAQVLIDVYKGY